MYWNGALTSSLANIYDNGSSTNTVVVSAPNGYYTWEVYEFTAPGYVWNPVAGGATVNGAGPSETVTFTYAPADRLVMVEEADYQDTGFNGIPNGTSWGAKLNGTTQDTMGMVLGFFVPNGTYSYTIVTPSGFVGLPSSGTFTLNSSSSAEFLLGGAYVFVAFTSSGGGSPASLAGIGTSSPVAVPSASVVFAGARLGRPAGP